MRLWSSPFRSQSTVDQRINKYDAFKNIAVNIILFQNTGVIDKQKYVEHSYYHFEKFAVKKIYPFFLYIEYAYSSRRLKM